MTLVGPRTHDHNHDFFGRWRLIITVAHSFASFLALGHGMTFVLSEPFRYRHEINSLNFIALSYPSSSKSDLMVRSQLLGCTIKQFCSDSRLTLLPLRFVSISNLAARSLLAVLRLITPLCRSCTHGLGAFVSGCPRVGWNQLMPCKQHPHRQVMILGKISILKKMKTNYRTV